MGACTGKQLCWQRTSWQVQRLTWASSWVHQVQVCPQGQILLIVLWEKEEKEKKKKRRRIINVLHQHECEHVYPIRFLWGLDRYNLNLIITSIYLDKCYKEFFSYHMNHQSQHEGWIMLGRGCLIQCFDWFSILTSPFGLVKCMIDLEIWL